MRAAILAITAALVMSGCAMGLARAPSASDGAAMAAPGPDLVGTWRGIAFAVPGSNYGVSTAVELTIAPDSTWIWTKGGQRQASGRVRMHGDRAVFEEGVDGRGIKANELQRRGDHLWGVSHTFIPGWMSAVDLRRVPES